MGKVGKAVHVWGNNARADLHDWIGVGKLKLSVERQTGITLSSLKVASIVVIPMICAYT